jgi:hypothetical protein
MATLIPAFSSCARRMTAGERRFAHFGGNSNSQKDKKQNRRKIVIDLSQSLTGTNYSGSRMPEIVSAFVTRGWARENRPIP